MENFFALIIGVGGDLAATAEDATAIKNLLCDPNKGGYLPENIAFLVNDDSTKKNVIDSLENIISKTKKLDKATVLVYYSGHGLQIPNDTDPEKIEYFLKTSGADKLKKEETMLNGALFSEKIKQIKADKLLILLDCCHADGMKYKNISELEGMMIEAKPSNRGLLEKLDSGEGRVFISACDDNEESVILPGSKNSLFTEVCLEVFDGKLSPNDEFVSVVDLMYYVIKEVPKRVLPFHHIQRPIISEVQNLSPDYFVCRNGNYKPVQKDLEDFLINNSAERIDFIKNYNNKI